ncbi:PAS domain-containing protein [Rhizobium sp. PL01]|uniref:blue-light-activated histidine kinase n=1 Tax=Rhizobium sp. PL01 TaxID=3085631 RepID=UPI002980C60E|nr:PAS domain-containing protein [Rhizobium sp. PL01]MDW5318473.1 PAS domain-containing protein [Rhizobium sp. PL01]
MSKPSVNQSSFEAEKSAAASLDGILARKELAVVAFERTRMPMVMVDPRQEDSPIVLANQAFLNLTGYTANEVVGRNCRFLQGEATSKLAIGEIRTGLATGRDVDVEILNYRKDGCSFWNQLHISAIHDDEGAVIYLFASQIDVTAYRKIQSLESSEHRLLMEVDHRAKNVLAVVDSIVRLSRSDDAGTYASSVQHRVQCLSRAHGLLSECGWQDVPLRRVVESQIQQFGAGQIIIEGPDMSFAAAIVQPFSLAIHELAVNATEHGALSTASGKLAITWVALPGDAGVSLRWIETGGPSPTATRPSGFGSVIVSALIEKQLRGRLTPQWSDTGLDLSMEIPRDAFQPTAQAGSPL